MNRTAAYGTGMLDKRASVWGWAVAGTALLAAISVYSLVRIDPPLLLTPLKATSASLAARADLFGSAPSLFYTFAVCVVLGLCAATRAAAVMHCRIWLAVSLLLEFSQHSMFAGSIAAWLSAGSGSPDLNAVLPFWSHGVFDWLDIVATLVGGMLALLLISFLAKRAGDDLS